MEASARPRPRSHPKDQGGGAKMFAILQRSRCSTNLLTANAARTTRSIYLGTIGKPVVDFVPITPEQRPAIWTKPGLKERWFRIVQFLRRRLGVYYIWKAIPGFSVNGFAKDTMKIFGLFMKSVHERNLSRCREVVTQNLYNDIKALPKGPKAPHAFSGVEFLREPRIINISPVELKAEKKIRIFQVTVKMEYRIFSEAEPVTEYIVFEHCPDVYNAGWRICGRVFPSNHYYAV